MSLRHLVRPKATVTLSDGQTFTVSGLSPNHAFGLYHRHRGQMSNLFDRVMTDTKAGTSSIASLGENIFGEAPLLLAEIIALAAGGNPFDETPADPDVPGGATVWQAELSMAVDMPLPVQLDALQKIGDLTFTPEMPPKKFLSALVAMMQGANQSLPVSGIGSGVSGDK
jgi:hypothetical protein